MNVRRLAERFLHPLHNFEEESDKNLKWRTRRWAQMRGISEEDADNLFHNAPMFYAPDHQPTSIESDLIVIRRRIKQFTDRLSRRF